MCAICCEEREEKNDSAIDASYSARRGQPDSFLTWRALLHRCIHLFVVVVGFFSFISVAEYSCRCAWLLHSLFIHVQFASTQIVNGIYMNLHRNGGPSFFYGVPWLLSMLIICMNFYILQLRWRFDFGIKIHWVANRSSRFFCVLRFYTCPKPVFGLKTCKYQNMKIRAHTEWLRWQRSATCNCKVYISKLNLFSKLFSVH